jgi:mannose/fructose/N-acetylgalactosamine-specific phosphotransferase system component IID
MAASVFAAKKLGWSPALAAGLDKVLIVLAAFVLLTFTKVHPVLLIVGAAVLGFLAYR